MKIIRIATCFLSFVMLIFVSFIMSSPNLICANSAVGTTQTLLNDIMPYVTAVSSGLVLVIAIVLPVAKKLLEVAKNLASSDRNLQDVLSENVMLKKELKLLHNKIETIEQSNEKIRKMTELGFCNMKELVEGGFAREIAEVGKTDNKQ